MKTFFVDIILRLVSLCRYFLFHSLEVYSREKGHNLLIKFPTLIIANHVSEFDVLVMTYIARYAEGKSRYTIPARQDIMEPGFLVNEFPSKGLLKKFLQFIDWTRIIPFLLTFVNAIPVKRPFRDNSRKLAKSGELRNIVDQNWEFIAEKIRTGLNVFIFPEGTYTFNGYINSFRRGVVLLKQKVENLKLNYITITYDHLSYSKVDVHITIGNLIDFPEGYTDEEISQFSRDLIGKNFVVHPGNIISFAILQEELKTGISMKEFFLKLKKFISELKTRSDFVLAKDFFHSKYQSLCKNILENAIDSGFLQKEKDVIRGTQKLFNVPDSKNWNFLKTNPYLYHKNQLLFHELALEKIWREIK